jgi:hypothetical protein
MLVIRVELHSAVTGKITEIARMLLWNDGTGDLNTGNYQGKAVQGSTKGPMDPAVIYKRKALRTGEVKDYPRLNLHVWNLVVRMLNNMQYK